jgi:hypothetical protein
MRTRMLATIGLGLLLAGCGGGKAQPPPAPFTAAQICADYGGALGPQGYDECIAYQEARIQAYSSPSVPPYRMDQYNNRVDAEGYRVDSIGRRMPVQSPYQLPLVAPPGNRN